jgi:transcriptional regulator with XRE-family HTH domain
MVSSNSVVKISGNQRAIGKAVKETRLKLGMTMTKFAKKVGVSQAQISRLEDGQQGFRTKTMQKIAEALGIPVVIYFGPKRQVETLIGK